MTDYLGPSWDHDPRGRTAYLELSHNTGVYTTGAKTKEGVLVNLDWDASDDTLVGVEVLW